MGVSKLLPSQLFQLIRVLVLPELKSKKAPKSKLVFGAFHFNRYLLIITYRSLKKRDWYISKLKRLEHEII
jgi:hypothetical protein